MPFLYQVTNTVAEALLKQIQTLALREKSDSFQ